MRNRMASQPKKRKLLATLSKLAEEELGPEASALDWVELQVSSGATMERIRDRVAAKWPDVHGSPASMSHDWLRWMIVKTWPEAKARLAAARAGAGVARLNSAIPLADEPVSAGAEVLTC